MQDRAQGAGGLDDIVHIGLTERPRDTSHLGHGGRALEHCMACLDGPLPTWVMPTSSTKSPASSSASRTRQPAGDMLLWGILRGMAPGACAVTRVT